MDNASREAAIREAKQFCQEMAAITGSGDLAGSIAKEYHRRASVAERGEYLRSLLLLSRMRASTWDGLILIVQQLLRADEPIPSELASWTADVLGDSSKPEQEKQSPRPPPRRDDYAKFARDELIAGAVTLLVLRGFKPMRTGSAGGRAGAGDSACDVVGPWFDLGYKAVEGIWTKSFTRRATPGTFERAGVLLDKDRE